MSRENVQNVRQGFETYNRLGIRAVARDFWHPAVEWEPGPWGAALGFPPRVRGHEEAISAFEEAESALGRLRVDVLDVLEGPEAVLAEVRLHGEGTESGAPVDQRFWYAIQMEAGRQKRIRVFGERGEAGEAVGLRE